MTRLPREALLQQLQELVQQAPDLAAPRELTDEERRWLGRALALVELEGHVLRRAAIRTAAGFLDGPTKAGNASRIMSTLYEAIATLELEFPATSTGTFIPAGGNFTALAAVGRVVAAASSDALFMDAYANFRVLSDFAVLAPEGVPIRVLACERHHKADLKPAAERWSLEHGTRRPLEVRLAAPGSLHDRWIVVDRQEVWQVGQSFNALAARAFTSITRVTDPEIRQLKLDAVEAIWNGAAPI